MSEDVAGDRPPQEQELVAEIEQTRQQLGETVEALAAKTDVKGRAQRRAAEVTGNLRGKARAVQDKVTGQRQARQAAVTVRAHPAMVAAAAGTLILAVLAIRQLMDTNAAEHLTRRNPGGPGRRRRA